MKDNEAPTFGYRGSEGSSAHAIGTGLKFANKRAQDWWQMYEALDPQAPDKIALPPDQELAADLATPRMSARAMQERGIIQIESKDEIRKRLGRSPDKGDAVVMCRAHGGLLMLRRSQAPRFRSFVNASPRQAQRLGIRSN